MATSEPPRRSDSDPRLRPPGAPSLRAAGCSTAVPRAAPGPPPALTMTGAGVRAPHRDGGAEPSRRPDGHATPPGSPRPRSTPPGPSREALGPAHPRGSAPPDRPATAAGDAARRPSPGGAFPVLREAPAHPDPSGPPDRASPKPLGLRPASSPHRGPADPRDLQPLGTHPKGSARAKATAQARLVHTRNEVLAATLSVARKKAGVMGSGTGHFLPSP